MPHFSAFLAGQSLPIYGFIFRLHAAHTSMPASHGPHPLLIFFKLILILFYFQNCFIIYVLYNKKYKKTSLKIKNWFLFFVIRIENKVFSKSIFLLFLIILIFFRIVLKNYCTTYRIIKNKTLNIKNIF